MKRRILVVDDDDAVRRAVTTSLHMMSDWDIFDAYCGTQALESARQSTPDAILLDVMMPAMDGPSMLSKLRSTRSTSDIPVILLTARVRAVDEGAFAHLPLAGILVKPFDPLRLATQVAQVLGWELPLKRRSVGPGESC